MQYNPDLKKNSLESSNKPLKKGDDDERVRRFFKAITYQTLKTAE